MRLNLFIVLRVIDSANSKGDSQYLGIDSVVTSKLIGIGIRTRIV